MDRGELLKFLACPKGQFSLHLACWVNNENVVKVGHRQVVNMIRQGGNHLVLKVVTVTRNLDPDDTARKKAPPPPKRAPTTALTLRSKSMTSELEELGSGFDSDSNRKGFQNLSASAKQDNGIKEVGKGIVSVIENVGFLAFGKRQIKSVDLFDRLSFVTRPNFQMLSLKQNTKLPLKFHLACRIGVGIDYILCFVFVLEQKPLLDNDHSSFKCGKREIFGIVT
ncbi:hypothetical protein BTVI_144175 [Pitangus sulphuratus]|nr:hypothetical protein BTVI_144175 [Pitangus sulphuratus]